MKESILVQMRNQIDTLGKVVQDMTREIYFLKDLAIGNHELAKLLPGYEAALQTLKDSVVETTKKVEEATADEAAKLGEE